MDGSHVYRSNLDEIRSRVNHEWTILSRTRAELGAGVKKLPAGLRRDLGRLEAVLSVPINSEQRARCAERAIVEYTERLDTAVCYADHVRRDEAARRRRISRFVLWTLVGSLPVWVAVAFAVSSWFENRRNTDSETCQVSCFQDGRCTRPISDVLFGGLVPICVMGSEDNCEFVCAMYGACTVRGGRCVVGGVANCRKSLACTQSGRCTAVAGECRATSELDCRSSAVCSWQGRCTPSEGACVALSVTDCQNSNRCRLAGACILHYPTQSCVTPDGTCHSALNCGEAGLCSTDAVGRCIAKEDAECEQSRACFDHGSCTARGGACVAASNGDCRHSKDCLNRGWCSASNGVCSGTPSDGDVFAAVPKRRNADRAASRGPHTRP